MGYMKRSRFQLSVGLLVGTCILAGCAESKDSAPASFDMSEYRKVMEKQKHEQAAQDNAEAPAKELAPEEHERAGDADAQQRNFPLAAVHYSKALKADPTRNGVRLKLGQILLQQGLLDAALTQFQDLQTRDPKSATAQQGIGQVYLHQGKLPEAETAIKKAVELDATSWLSFNLLGLAYDQAQRHADAIAAYRSALAIRPREPGVLNNLGLAYALSGNHEEAIRAYEEALRSGSNSPKLHNNLGVAYARLERYADAQTVVKQGAADYINIKIMKTGVVEAREIAAYTLKAGLKLMIGGMVETRIAMGCSFSLVLGMRGFDVLDLDTPLLLATDPVTGGYLYKGAYLQPWSDPGLGIVADGTPLTVIG